MADPRNPIIPSIQKGIAKRWQPIENGTREWWRGYREWLRGARAPGTVTLTPDTVTAGSRQRLKLTFRVGKGGIAPYGHIAVEPPLSPLIPHSPGPPRPAARFRVTCSNPRPELQVEVSDGIIDVLIKEYPLEEGDELVFHFGEEEGNKAVMPAAARQHPFPVAVARKNWPVYQLIEEIPELTVTGAPARRFLVAPKPAVTQAKPFALQIVALDGVHGNPDPNYEGRVRLVCTDPKADIPERVSFTEDDGGIKVIEGLRLGNPGMHYITAVDEWRGISGRSNPLTADDFFDGLNVYFGDIHVHTWHCDGHATPEEAYHWSREVRAMDFGAITNHVEGAKRYHVDDFWPIVQEMAKKHNVPGEYVAFLAFEWGGWDLFGDKCVYYLDDDQPCYGANMPESNSPDKLWSVLPRGRAITIPHHVKFGGRTDWSFHDPQMQPLVEIFSQWGVGEDGGPWCVQQALERGYRFGFIASSDNHAGEPGTPTSGIAAVVAPELTREAIFTGLASRQCYATTGVRILLNVTVNGHGMGEEFSLPADEPRKVEVKVAGTGDLAEVHVLKCNRDIRVFEPGEPGAKMRFEDEARLEGPTWYYVRVVQTDGAMAWSSPIWVDPE